MEDLIKEIYKREDSQLSGLVTWLDDYANVLSNKNQWLLNLKNIVGEWVLAGSNKFIFDKSLVTSSDTILFSNFI